MLNQLKSVAFLLSCVSIGLATAQNLKPTTHPFPNYTFIKSSKNNVLTSISIGKTGNMDVKQDIAIDMEIKINPSKKSEQEINLVYKKMTGTIEQMGKKTELPGDQIVGKKLNFTCDNNGVITDLQGDKEILEQFQKNSMLSSFSKGKHYSQFLNLTTEKKIGDIWIDSSMNDSTNSFINKFNYVRNENGHAILDAIGDIAMNSDLEQMGQTIHTNLSGKFIGQYVIDLSTNMIISTKGKMNANGTMSVSGNTIPMRISGTTDEVNTIKK